MTEPAPPPLPARPDLRPGEDIAALLARTASANHTTVRELTGLQVHSRVWEEPRMTCCTASRHSPRPPWTS